jgi:hypothetical protein
MALAAFMDGLQTKLSKGWKVIYGCLRQACADAWIA